MFELPLLAEHQCKQQLVSKGLINSSNSLEAHFCTVGERSTRHCRVSCMRRLTFFSIFYILYNTKQGKHHDRGTGLFCPLGTQSNIVRGVLHYVQIGVSSWGQRCHGFPGVYTKIDFFAKWIDEVIREVDEEDEDEDD